MSSGDFTEIDSVSLLEIAKLLCESDLNPKPDLVDPLETDLRLSLSFKESCCCARSTFIILVDFSLSS